MLIMQSRREILWKSPWTKELWTYFINHQRYSWLNAIKSKIFNIELLTAYFVLD